MKYKLLKDLYDCFYTRPELPAQKQEIARTERGAGQAGASAGAPDHRRKGPYCRGHLHRQLHLRI